MFNRFSGLQQHNAYLTTFFLNIFSDSAHTHPTTRNVGDRRRGGLGRGEAHLLGHGAE